MPDPALSTAERFYRASRLPFWGLVGLLCLGCSAIQVVEAPKKALLEIDCQPPDAVISIDGEALGVIGALRGGVLPVAPGQRRVEITREGYFPYLLDLDAQAGRAYRLQLDLIRDIDEDLDDAPPIERAFEGKLPGRL